MLLENNFTSRMMYILLFLFSLNIFNQSSLILAAVFILVVIFDRGKLYIPANDNVFVVLVFFAAVFFVFSAQNGLNAGNNWYVIPLGNKHCKNELVARMDSDDIAYPDRCEKQIAVFNTHSEVSICSGIVEEFTTDPNTVDTRRVLPETNAEIVEFAKKRNPFNHPCVMYKKSAVEAVGSYQDFYLLEDYYLWLRMLMAGYQGYNIQEPLLHMRAGSDMYLRRAGWKYAKTQARLFKFMKKQGFIGEGQCIKSCVIRSGSALAPNWLRKFMFEKALRA